MRRLWTIIGVGDVASHQLGDAEAAEGCGRQPRGYFPTRVPS
jgi:hypothetical protein